MTTASTMHPGLRTINETIAIFEEGFLKAQCTADLMKHLLDENRKNLIHVPPTHPDQAKVARRVNVLEGIVRFQETNHGQLVQEKDYFLGLRIALTNELNGTAPDQNLVDGYMKTLEALQVQMADNAFEFGARYMAMIASVEPELAQGIEAVHRARGPAENVIYDVYAGKRTVPNTHSALERISKCHYYASLELSMTNYGLSEAEDRQQFFKATHPDDDVLHTQLSAEIQAYKSLGELIKQRIGQLDHQKATMESVIRERDTELAKRPVDQVKCFAQTKRVVSLAEQNDESKWTYLVKFMALLGTANPEQYRQTVVRFHSVDESGRTEVCISSIAGYRCKITEALHYPQVGVPNPKPYTDPTKAGYGEIIKRIEIRREAIEKQLGVLTGIDAALKKEMTKGASERDDVVTNQAANAVFAYTKQYGDSAGAYRADLLALFKKYDPDKAREVEGQKQDAN
ncbi:hypothetical protein EK21DRAFT_111792 [Setomelanomma holmii]|uniref:Uncharacterized protein n=1 Tax=Setomelanomma holmii TaxID=210430 RepID=A0A9P4LM26_9PLEO|nr:hypothetical protein EK21DRAFT_111792 [Setomelanomma holmii]